MAAPTVQNDIVIIHETYGTPANQNKVQAYKTVLTFTGVNLTKVEEIMMDGITEVLRKEITLVYTGSNLTSVRTKIFDLDGVTVELDYTDTLTYTGNDLTLVERTVN